MQSYISTYYRLRLLEERTFDRSVLPPGGGGGVLIFYTRHTPDLAEVVPNCFAAYLRTRAVIRGANSTSPYPQGGEGGWLGTEMGSAQEFPSGQLIVQLSLLSLLRNGRKNNGRRHQNRVWFSLKGTNQFRLRGSRETNDSFEKGNPWLNSMTVLR